MKTKKGKKRDSSSDSSNSSSDSSDSSGSPQKKSHKSKESQSSKTKHSKSASADREKSSKEKQHTEQDNAKAKRKEIEHSKWDSPVERGDRKRKAEKKSGSRDRRDSRDGRRDDERRDSRDGRREEEHRDSRVGRRDEERRDGDRRHDRNRRRDEEQHTQRHYNERDRSRDGRHDNRTHDDKRGGDRNRNNDNERHHRSPARGQNDRDRNRNNNNRRRRSRSGSFDHSKATWGRGDQQGEKGNKGGPNAQKEKEKPNFGLSGKLTEETNTFKGVVIKYSEPPEARKPKRRWRLYPFKGEKAMQTLYIHRESAYLVGRDRKVVDLPVDHPSCSKQHAAIQYRLVPFLRDDGSTGKRVRPYLIDLESANGTFINNKKIDGRKYVELLEKDVIKFGFSSREYVLLHENSKDEAMDDDVKVEEEVAVKNEPED